MLSLARFQAPAAAGPSVFPALAGGGFLSSSSKRDKGPPSTEGSLASALAQPPGHPFPIPESPNDLSEAKHNQSPTSLSVSFSILSFDAPPPTPSPPPDARSRIGFPPSCPPLPIERPRFRSVVVDLRLRGCQCPARPIPYQARLECHTSLGKAGTIWSIHATLPVSTSDLLHCPSQLQDTTARTGPSQLNEDPEVSLIGSVSKTTAASHLQTDAVLPRAIPRCYAGCSSFCPR